MLNGINTRKMGNKILLSLLLLFPVSCAGSDKNIFSFIEVQKKECKSMMSFIPAGTLNGRNLFKESKEGSCTYYLKEGNSYNSMILDIPSDVSLLYACDDNILYGICDDEKENQKKVYYSSSDKQVKKEFVFPYMCDDRFFECKFVKHGKCVTIVSPHESVYDYGEVDEYSSKLIVYDCENQTSKTIPFDSCRNAHLMNNGAIVWDRERHYSFNDERHEQSSTDICYLSSDGEEKIISCNSYVLSCSPDSKYILAQKEVCGRNYPIVINIETGKCVYYVTPEELYDEYFFYDMEREQFAYDKGAEILYLRMDAFPNDPMEKCPYDKKQIESFKKKIIGR